MPVFESPTDSGLAWTTSFHNLHSGTRNLNWKGQALVNLGCLHILPLVSMPP
jgi:hypothetical protein